jgi:DNA-binding transcriptional ArsR family regulator
VSSENGPSETSPATAVTDSRAIRALAHPVRIALLELLGHTGTLTATQASEVLDESPANCAFHLRTLGKYGFVEEAGGGRGRERPWRRVHTVLRVAADGASPDHAAAATALSDLVLATLAGRARATLARRDAWPEGWQHGALSQAAYTSYLTLPEARQLRADLHALLTRHFDRVDHPERRPAGALPVEFLAVAYPLLHLLEVPTAAAPAPAPEES